MVLVGNFYNAEKKKCSDALSQGDNVFEPKLREFPCTANSILWSWYVPKTKDGGVFLGLCSVPSVEGLSVWGLFWIVSSLPFHIPAAAIHLWARCREHRGLLPWVTLLMCSLSSLTLLTTSCLYRRHSWEKPPNLTLSPFELLPHLSNLMSWVWMCCGGLGVSMPAEQSTFFFFFFNRIDCC